jgi:hypothetical protein
MVVCPTVPTIAHAGRDDVGGSSMVRIEQRSFDPADDPGFARRNRAAISLAD